MKHALSKSKVAGSRSQVIIIDGFLVGDKGEVERGKMS